jgi:hypothetical protein
MPSCRVLTTVVLAALPLIGCAEHATDADEASPSDAAHVTPALFAQVENPGQARVTAPSTLPGVKQWVAYVGGGVTIEGRDEAGTAQAIFAIAAADEKGATNTLCLVSPSVAPSCESVVRAISGDLRGPEPAIGTKALRPLANPPGQPRSCEAILSDLADHAGTPGKNCNDLTTAFQQMFCTFGTSQPDAIRVLEEGAEGTCSCGQPASSLGSLGSLGSLQDDGSGGLILGPPAKVICK